MNKNNNAERRENDNLKTICEYGCMTLQEYADARVDCLHPATQKCDNCHRRICEGVDGNESEVYTAEDFKNMTENVNDERRKELELYTKIGQKLNEEEEEFLKEMWQKRLDEVRKEAKRELRKLKK